MLKILCFAVWMRIKAGASFNIVRLQLKMKQKSEGKKGSNFNNK